MRNICLVIAVLLALPFSADAQERPRAGRGAAPAQRAEQRGGDERRAERRQSDQRQSDQRQAERQSDQRQSNQSHAARQPEQRPTTGLTPLGLPPPRPTQLPWWEQRQTPAWEKRQTPYWEKQSAPFWEGQPPPVWENPTRAGQSLVRQPYRGQHVNGKQRRHFKYPPAYYVLPAYGYYTGTTFGYGVSTSTSYVEPPPPVYEAPLPETGVLQLDVEPRQTLQVFVDGLYIGTLADLGEEIELRLGARRIELRAPGYRTLVFDTEIVPDRIIVYRGALDRLPETPAAPRAPDARTPEAPRAAPQAPQAPRSRTMYLIPGCYMGNVEPTASMLRPGCDLSKLTTILPQ